MTEDGRDWGERCVDMYKIVDKVASAAATWYTEFFLSGWGGHLWRSVQGNSPTRNDDRERRAFSPQEGEIFNLTHRPLLQFNLKIIHMISCEGSS